MKEIFRIVATHLLAQNEQAVGIVLGHPSCMYRAPNGCKCAIGILIGDNDYSPSMEGKGAQVGEVCQALIKNGVDMLHQDVSSLVANLQRIHDLQKPEVWRLELMVYADSLRFEMPS